MEVQCTATDHWGGRLQRLQTLTGKHLYHPCTSGQLGGGRGVTFDLNMIFNSIKVLMPPPICSRAKVAQCLFWTQLFCHLPGLAMICWHKTNMCALRMPDLERYEIAEIFLIWYGVSLHEVYVLAHEGWPSMEGRLMVLNLEMRVFT